MFFKKVFIRFIFVISFLIYFVFPKTIFAQAEPASGCSGWQGDIALRGDSWHHRGTVKGLETQVDAGFINPSGSWEAPTYIYYGEGALVPTSSMYLSYTWWAEGAYLVRIYNSAGCYFDRRVFVANIVESYGNVSVDNSQSTYSITRPGMEICGTLANYTQSVTDTVPIDGSAGFSMGLLGTDYNLYRGQPGGDRGVSWMTTPLNANINTSNSSYSIDYRMAGISTDTVSWTISPLNGATASWGINNLLLYLDCKPYKGTPPASPPTPTPTPTAPVPTPTITCPLFTDKYCGTNQIIVYWNAVVGSSAYKMYRNDVYLNWDSNFTSFTDTNAPCGISYSYDVKPHYAGQPERDCQQNYSVLCACGATLAPTPTTAVSSPTPTPTTGACVSVCPSGPQKPITPSDLGTINSLPYTLTWTAPSSWGTVCAPAVQNNHYHLYVSTTGVGASGTLKDSTGLFINGINVATNSYLLSSGLTEGQAYYWQVFAVNQ